jgi:hypothetical protein
MAPHKIDAHMILLLEALHFSDLLQVFSCLNSTVP